MQSGKEPRVELNAVLSGITGWGWTIKADHPRGLRIDANKAHVETQVYSGNSNFSTYSSSIEFPQNVAIWSFTAPSLVSIT